MRDLDDIRREIDGIDGQLARLVKRRLELACDIAAAKSAIGKPVSDPAREEAVLARVSTIMGEDAVAEARAVFSTLFALSRERQKKLIEANAVKGART